MAEIVIDTPVMVGDRVLVENYKSPRKPMEPGTVQTVEVGIYPNGSYHLSFDVILDRRAKGTDWNPHGKALRLHVGLRQIRKI